MLCSTLTPIASAKHRHDESHNRAPSKPGAASPCLPSSSLGSSSGQEDEEGTRPRSCTFSLRSLHDPDTSSSSSLLFSSFPKHAPSASPPFAIFRIHPSSQKDPRARPDVLLASLFSACVHHQFMWTTSSSLQHAWPQPTQRGPHRLLLAFCTKSHLSSAPCFNTKVGSPWNHSRGDSPVATSLRGGSV